VQLIPLEWLQGRYWRSPKLFSWSLLSILATRLNHSEIFINEAQNAREALIWVCRNWVVPRREEFLNVGIVLFVKKAKFIKMIYTVNEAKINCFLLILSVSSCNTI
jgi:hypothetical protein